MKFSEILSLGILIILLVSCIKPQKQIKQSITYDTTISKLTKSINLEETLRSDTISIIFDYGFDNKLNIKSNNKSVVKSTIMTNEVTGFAGSFFITKTGNNQRLEILLDDIRVADFVLDTNYRIIHIYHISDSIKVEFTNNVYGYE
jgi:hypothetical protein